MIYTYKCLKCGEFDIVKHHTEMDNPEYCDCGDLMNRIFNPVIHVSTGSFKPGLNHAFGKHFSTEREQKDYLKKIKDTTGKEYVEVGTDSMSGIKKEFKKVDIREAQMELRAELVKRGVS
jgi:hypothetical protein